jgi:hypothetical protein
VKKFTVDFFFFFCETSAIAAFGEPRRKLPLLLGGLLLFYVAATAVQTDVASSSTVFATAKSLFLLLHMIFFPLAFSTIYQLLEALNTQIFNLLRFYRLIKSLQLAYFDLYIYRKMNQLRF